MVSCIEDRLVEQKKGPKGKEHVLIKIKMASFPELTLHHRRLLSTEDGKFLSPKDQVFW